jgi:phosphatidylglycerol---prolipoprotein diacylglyceryl transferase
MAYPYLQDLVSAATGLHLPLPVPTFGLCVLGAVLVSEAFAKAEVRRLHTAGDMGLAVRHVRRDGQRTEVRVPPQDVVFDFVLAVVLAGILGARVFSIAETPHEFLSDPWGMIFSRQGLNFLGGLLFGIAAGILFVRARRLALPVACDAFAPSLMLAYALGRIGCQLAGDGDWGLAANMPLKPHWLPTVLWAQTYDHNILGQAIAPPGVYPTPLYEILMSLACFGVLWALRKHPFRHGWLFAVYLILTGLERLAIEPIRVNTRTSVLGLQVTQAQVISFLLVVCGVVGVVLLTRRRSTSAQGGTSSTSVSSPG